MGEDGQFEVVVECDGDECLRWSGYAENLTDALYRALGERERQVAELEAHQDYPKGLCGNRDEHAPHKHNSLTLGRFWCTADQMDREPGRSEFRRKHAA